MVLGGAVDALDPERLDRLARAVAPACEAWSLRAVSETGESLRVRQDIAEAPSRTRHQGVMITVTDQGGMGHAATADASEAGLRGAFAHARALARIMAGRGVVDFRYVENTDIAFNLLRWIPEHIRFPALLVSGAIAVVVMLALLFQGYGEGRLPRIALVLVTAGAIGNYLDRVVRGYVVDFVHVHHWPVFNVADVYITVGYALFACAFFLHRRAQALAHRTAS